MNQSLCNMEMPSPASKDFDRVDLKKEPGVYFLNKNLGISDTADLYSTL